MTVCIPTKLYVILTFFEHLLYHLLKKQNVTGAVSAPSTWPSPLTLRPLPREPRAEIPTSAALAGLRGSPAVLNTGNFVSRVPHSAWTSATCFFLRCKQAQTIRVNCCTVLVDECTGHLLPVNERLECSWFLAVMNISALPRVWVQVRKFSRSVFRRGNTIF